MEVTFAALGNILNDLGYQVSIHEGVMSAQKGGAQLHFVEDSRGMGIGAFPSEVMIKIEEQGALQGGNFKPADGEPTGVEEITPDKFGVSKGDQADPGEMTGSPEPGTKATEIPGEYRSHGVNNQPSNVPKSKSGTDGPSVGAHDAPGGKDAGADASKQERSSDGIEVADIYPPDETGDYTGTAVGDVSGVNTGPGRGGGKAPEGGSQPAPLPTTQGAQAGTANIPGAPKGNMAVTRESLEKALAEADVYGGGKPSYDAGPVRWKPDVTKQTKKDIFTQAQAKGAGRAAREKASKAPMRQPGENDAEYEHRYRKWARGRPQPESLVVEAEPAGRFAVLLTRESRGNPWQVAKALDNDEQAITELNQNANQYVRDGGPESGAVVVATDTDRNDIPDQGDDLAGFVGEIRGQLAAQFGQAQETAAEPKFVSDSIDLPTTLCPHCYKDMDLRMIETQITPEMAKVIVEQFPGEEEDEEDDIPPLPGEEEEGDPDEFDVSPALKQGDDMPPEMETPPEGEAPVGPPGDMGEVPGDEVPPPPAPPAPGGDIGLDMPPGPPGEGEGGGEENGQGVLGPGAVACPNCGRDVQDKLRVAGVLNDLAKEIMSRATRSAAATGTPMESAGGSQSATNETSRSTETEGEKEDRLSRAWQESPEDYVEGLIDGLVDNPDLLQKAAAMILGSVGLIREDFRDEDAADAAKILEQLEGRVREIRNDLMDVRLGMVGKIQTLVGTKFGRGTYAENADRLMTHISEQEKNLTNFLVGLEQYRDQFQRRFGGEVGGAPGELPADAPAPEVGGGAPAEGPGTMAPGAGEPEPASLAASQR